MTKKNIKCSHAGLGRMMALRAQGQRRFDDIVGSRHHVIGEDNVLAGSGTMSWAWGWRLRGQRHHRLGSGKMAACKGLDHGRERRWEALRRTR
jgi:hypothetical protein